MNNKNAKGGWRSGLWLSDEADNQAGDEREQKQEQGQIQKPHICQQLFGPMTSFTKCP
jgi:hypothetical protein